MVSWSGSAGRGDPAAGLISACRAQGTGDAAPTKPLGWALCGRRVAAAGGPGLRPCPSPPARPELGPPLCLGSPGGPAGRWAGVSSCARSPLCSQDETRVTPLGAADQRTKAAFTTVRTTRRPGQSWEEVAPGRPPGRRPEDRAGPRQAGRLSSALLIWAFSNLGLQKGEQDAGSEEMFGKFRRMQKVFKRSIPRIKVKS